MNPALGTELRSLYTEEFARIRKSFSESGDGRAAVSARTRLVESIFSRLWSETVSPEPDGPEGVVLVALGGFGRIGLFPYSDVDILFLFESGGTESKAKTQIRDFSQSLWDLRMRLSPASRKISECERLNPENLEFVISLLDCRYLAGDPRLFDTLREQGIPHSVGRESKTLVERLAELTRTRHAKFGFTVFHLEPNVKDAPGGLRDHNLVGWLSTISALEKGCGWAGTESPLPAARRRQFETAFNFLTSVRCFLHFRHNRDDNTLTWEAQNEAAARHIGMGGDASVSVEDWMRVYFRHARSIYRVSSQMLEEIPVSRPSLHRQIQSLRSRLSNSEFSVVEDFIFLRQPESIHDLQMMLRAFRFLARHSLRLSSITEHQIQQALPGVAEKPWEGHSLWVALQEILLAPRAADALRDMHHLGLLKLLLPELADIDSLVVRDYLHRYTVDEHTFVAIENLHRLRQSQSKWDQRYAEILEEVEQPELLYLALLLHDTGKGAKTDNHVRASVELAESALNRLGLDSFDRETVLFLVERHLEMSATLRRDIFDPATVRGFAEKVGTPERLKMLCLLTYADIKAVSPDTLTPWKAENVWQLYIGAANDMIRTVDERLHVNTDDEVMAHLRTLVPAAGKRLENFLEGLPRRYLRSYSVEEILSHMEMAERLRSEPIQLSLRRGRHWYEITLVTQDRPYLFSNMTGVLSAWGMNIVKAAAFSNQAAAVVDTFYFTDRFRTLELNLPEWDRFKKSIQDVLAGHADLEKMLRDRMRSLRPAPPKVIVKTDVGIDNEASEHSTLVEVITQDQPGLLHRISSQFAHLDCNIEIAVIATEGQMAIDVFYLTAGGTKLSPERQSQLREALLKELA
jgi:[protein-PII] uridylyltransferase